MSDSDQIIADLAEVFSKGDLDESGNYEFSFVFATEGGAGLVAARTRYYSIARAIVESFGPQFSEIWVTGESP